MAADAALQLWAGCREQYGRASAVPGLWLFGAFSIADAMHAPVASRFDTYNVPLPSGAAAYRDALLGHPAMRAWADDAVAQGVSLPSYDAHARHYGGPRSA